MPDMAARIRKRMTVDKWFPVTTAWGVLRLWIVERPPDVDGSSEYIE
jgi:hypothetical protein